MSKSIYLCSRKTLPASVEKKLHKICTKLSPDNITPAEPKIVIDGAIAYGIMNPTKTLLESNNSLLLGQIFDKNEKWSEPLTEFPDGSYALFRDGKEYCEIVSDPVASRTIWYYLDENVFIASTSQRAIVMFMGNFEFDERVIPWMLSTGSLGPTLSWDKRIKRVPPDSSIILDKNNWSTSSKTNPIEFNLVKRSDEENKEILKEALKNTFRSLNLDGLKWALPLSGGYDSRGILCLLHTNSDPQNLRSITWGLESSIYVKGSDADVAKDLAKKLNVHHKYYHTDLSTEPIDRIINRFILLGEGRIDHLSGYMDGFKIWKTLFEDEIEGIIRGDEGFGWEQVSSALTIRLVIGCGLCSDFSNLKDYTKYGFPLQEIPKHLLQRKEETLNVWRDRLYHEYRLPIILAALSDLKLAYVEQITPLLSKEILQKVRQLPDHLRTEKVLFKNIVNSISPKIDYATVESTASYKDILKQKQIADFLKNELCSNDTKKVFPSEFLDVIFKGIQSEDKGKTAKANSFSFRSFIKKILPNFLINAILKVSSPSIDPNVLAFRVFLISKMNKILNDDCN